MYFGEFVQFPARDFWIKSKVKIAFLIGNNEPYEKRVRVMTEHFLLDKRKLPKPPKQTVFCTSKFALTVMVTETILNQRPILISSTVPYQHHWILTRTGTMLRTMEFKTLMTILGQVKLLHHTKPNSWKQESFRIYEMIEYYNYKPYTWKILTWETQAYSKFHLGFCDIHMKV